MITDRECLSGILTPGSLSLTDQRQILSGITHWREQAGVSGDLAHNGVIKPAY